MSGRVRLGLLWLNKKFCRQVFPEVDVDRHLDLRLDRLAEHDRAVQLVDALITLLSLPLRDDAVDGFHFDLLYVFRHEVVADDGDVLLALPHVEVRRDSVDGSVCHEDPVDGREFLQKKADEMFAFFAVLDVEAFPQLHFIGEAREIGSEAFDAPADVVVLAVGADNDIGPGATGESFQEAPRQKSALIGVLSDARQGFESGYLRVEEDDGVAGGQTAQQRRCLVRDDRRDEEPGELQRVKRCHGLRKRSPDVAVELEPPDTHSKSRKFSLCLLNSGTGHAPVPRVLIRYRHDHRERVLFVELQVPGNWIRCVPRLFDDG